jgi:hypothetical protein
MAEAGESCLLPGRDGEATRMRNLLLRDVAIVLAAKLMALTIIYLLFFGAAHQPRIDAPQMAQWVLGTPASANAR